VKGFFYIHVSCNNIEIFLHLFQMGTNYKAALIPQRIRETIHGWGKAARKKRRHGMFADDSTIHTDTSTVLSIEEDYQTICDPHKDLATGTEVELQPVPTVTSTPSPIANETSSRAITPLLRPSASVSSSSVPFNSRQEEPIPRSSSMPSGR
jgi:mlo protein